MKFDTFICIPNLDFLTAFIVLKLLRIMTKTWFYIIYIARHQSRIRFRKFKAGNGADQKGSALHIPQYCFKPRENKNFFDILIHLNIFVDPYCLSSLSYPK